MRQEVQDSWTIRKATDGDTEKIACFQDSLNRPRRSDSIGSEYFLAESDQEIVGCAAVRTCGQQGYLYGLVVCKSWRRRGVGRALTDRRLDWLREMGADKVFVLAMFWNIRFFKRHGFELVDRHKKRELVNLHQDFVDKWSARSALLMADLHSSQSSDV